MSYEPSHRKPPRQERWPNATPGEGWPAYQQGAGGRSGASADALAGSRNGHAAASNGYGDANGGYGNANGGGYGDPSGGYGDAWGGRTAIAEYGYGDTWDGRGAAHQYDEPASGYWAGRNGYGATTTEYPASGDGYADGFDGAADGYAADGYAADGYRGGHADGYGQGQDYYQAGGWDGYAQPGHEFTAPARYQEQDEYPALEPGTSAVLVAPDTLGEWWRQPEAGTDRNLGRGLVVGAVMGILAAAVAIGVATFAAAFVRPQASPASVVGSIFIHRIPATLKHSVMTHFGAHDRTVLLLGMYVAIGLIAMVLGCMARRNPSVGVAGIAAFGLLGAFIVITRPESRASDVIPSAIGAVAGIMALLWLARASAPTAVAAASRRPSYGGGRRRTR
jgi:hypothetical protein